MRPLVADIAQLTDQRPLGAAQSLLENLLPLVPHHCQQARRVPFRLRAAGEEMRLRLGYRSTRLNQPELIVLGLHLPLNIGLQPGLQKVHGLGYPVIIRSRHRRVLAF